MGRPALEAGTVGKSPYMGAALTRPMARQVKRYADKQGISHGEAIRRLLGVGLAYAPVMNGLEGIDCG